MKQPSMIETVTTGQRIKARRLARNLTQAKAASLLGVSQSRWADLEADRKSPTCDTLERVAKVLRCHAWYFLKPDRA